jgi:hypothetical protein
MSDALLPPQGSDRAGRGEVLEHKIVLSGVTFDDVLLLPRYSDCVPS